MSVHRNVTFVFILHSIATNSTFEMALLKKQKSPIYSSCPEPDYVSDPFKVFFYLPSFFLSHKDLAKIVHVLFAWSCVLRTVPI